MPAPVLTQTLPIAPARPADAPLALAVAVAPVLAEPGSVVTYTVSLTNRLAQPLVGVVLSDSLPASLTPLAGGSGFVFDPAGRRLTWRIARLAAGAIVSATFQARLGDLALGQALTNTVTAEAAGAAGQVDAAAVLLAAPPAADETWVTPEQGGWLRSRDQRVLLHAPAGATAGRWRLVYRPLTQEVAPDGGLRTTFSIEARGAGGALLRRLPRPLKVRYAMGGASPAAQPALRAFTADSPDWVPLTTTVQAQTGLVEVTLDQPALVAAGPMVAAGDADIVPEPAPGITGVQAQLFSGSVSVDYPLEVPPGPGGLTPELALHYSSADLPGFGHHQAFGWGWSLPAASYVMRHPDPTRWYEYILVLNGVSYNIVGVGDNRFQARQNPFIYITRGAAESPDYPPMEVFDQDDPQKYRTVDLPQAPAQANRNSEGWDVTTEDGTQYHFVPAEYSRGYDQGNNQITHDFRK